MSQTGYTPILLYSSSTGGNTPSAGNLTNSTLGSELAINIADKNLFFKDSSNVVNTVPIRQSSGSSNGWLSSTDWTTFNNKQPAGTYVTSVSGTAPVVSSGGTTPTISMAAATSSVNGYLTSTDWSTFNGKQAALVSGTNIKTVNSTSLLGSGDVSVGVLTVTGTAPVVSSGGANPAISMAVANGTTNGYLSSTDWTTFNNKSNTNGTVTSVAALTLGTTGTDLSSTVANGTTTPVITLNVPTASSVNRGALSAADWTTFNSKAPGVTFTTNYIPYGQGTTTLNQSAGLQFDGTNFTTTGFATATSFIPSSSTVPTNGMYLPAANSVGIATNSTNAIYISSSQNVGVGTASPNYKITLGGQTGGTATPLALRFSNDYSNNKTAASSKIFLYNDGAAGNAFGFAVGNDADVQYHAGSTGASSGNHRWYTNDTERMRIASNGIITMSAYGAGAATFSAAGVISSVSDETWKTKDGVPLNPDEMLQKLEPGYWFYNEEKAPIFGTDRQLGFYAQNVNEAIGEEAAPTPEEGKPWGYYDRSVLAVTVMSLQKALATIENLTLRIKALESK